MKRAIPINLSGKVGGYEVFVRRYWPEGPHLKSQAEIWNGQVLASDGVLLGSATSRRRLLKSAAERHPLTDEERGLLDTELARHGTAVEEHHRLRQVRAVDAGGTLVDAGDARLPTRSVPQGDDEEQAESQSTQLVRLAADWELFRTPEGDLFATMPTGQSQRATYRLRSKQARDQLSYRYWIGQGRTPRTQALQDALGVLAGQAQHEGKELPVHVRLAEQGGAIYLDLGDPSWEAVAVTRTGWAILPSDQVPVKFRRPRGLLALPRPARGGSLSGLRDFLNVGDDAWILLAGWLVQACRPSGPYPVLALHGWQGSAKSTTARLLRSLIDPNIAPLRKEPKEDRDLIIAATNGWTVALDNLSRIPDWLSDALCRLSTGGGISSRELYSDNEEVILDAQRPVILTGIEELATRADLLDRALVCGLEAIPDERRVPERALWPRFEAARPAILGALLDAAAGALAREASVHLERLPRMADFAIWVTAAEPALGWEPGDFMRVYTENREQANDLALEAVDIVPHLRALVEEHTAWEGTMSALLTALNERAGEAAAKQQGWPKKPHTLSGMLTRIAPNLRATGIRFWMTRGPKPARARLVHLTCEGNGGGNERPPASPRERERPPERPPFEASVPPASPLITHSSEGERIEGTLGDEGDAPIPLYSSPPYSDRMVTSGVHAPDTNRRGPAAGYTLVTDLHGVVEAHRDLAEHSVIGLDTETTGLDPRRDRLRLVTLSTADHTYAIDTWICPRWQDVVRHLLADPGRTIVGHNLAFDLRFLLANGIEVGAACFDTYLASMVLDGGEHQGGKGYHTLAGVVQRELGQSLDKTEQKGAWGAQTLTPAQLDYAARDAAILLLLHVRLQERLAAEGLDGVAAIEHGCLPAMARMAHAGMAFDQEAWVRLADAAVLEQQRLEREILALLTAELGATGLFGYDCNLDSPAQLLKALAALGIEAPDTNEGTLGTLQDRHPAIGLLLAYREAAKKAGMYGIEFAAKHVHPATGRIHADFRQIGAASGRMSCTSPNLQNIPRSRDYRACFRPADGHALVKADYSAIELRLAAVIAGDAAMLAAFREGADLHKRTAATVLGVPEDQVTKEQRQLAKALNFGLIYGMGARTLVEHAATGYGVKLTEVEAAGHRDRFFATYRGLRRWHQGLPREVIDTRTLAGRIRRNVEAFTWKANTPVQGSGADGIKAALARLWRHREDAPTARLVAVVHDEIVAECPAQDAPAVADWLTEHMEAAMTEIVAGAVPIEVEATIARDWAGMPLEGAQP